MFKFLLFVALLVGVWYIFFRKSRKKPTTPPEEEVMVECKACGTYVSSKEALIKDRHYFCSRHCLEAQ